MTEKATREHGYCLQPRSAGWRHDSPNVFYKILLIMSLLTLAPGAMANDAPLQIFEGVNYQATSSTLEAYTVYSGDAIPNGLNKKTSSLILKKGYQVCIATKEKGQGLSKVLIAVNRDIRIPKLSAQFNDAITFLRVTPFRNVAKRGHCGNPDPRFNAAWFYTWGGTKESTENLLWTPMIFPKKKAGEWTTDLVKRTDIQEVIGFNEPDSPEGWRVVKPDYAVRLLQNALSVGIRMGSPSPRESGPRKWLPEFMEAAKAQNLRVDFLCLHWYDRQAARKAKNRNDSGEEVFDRFKTYMTTV